MEGRTYKYFRGELLYPFGYGLSFSEFVYYDMKLKTKDNKIELFVNIKNKGALDGDEILQVYATKKKSQNWRQVKQLVGFKRVSLCQGEEKAVSILIDKKQLQYWDVDQRKYIIEPGEYEIQVGSSSDDIRIKQFIDL